MDVKIDDKMVFRYFLSWQKTLLLEGVVETIEYKPYYIVKVISAEWEHAIGRRYMVMDKEVVSINGILSDADSVSIAQRKGKG
jgi:hypothetical protein